MKKKFALLALIVAITFVLLSMAQFTDAQGNFPMMKQMQRFGAENFEFNRAFKGNCW